MRIESELEEQLGRPLRHISSRLVKKPVEERNTMMRLE
jgi:hypothetical protein